MRIQQLPLSSITPSERNPRRRLTGLAELAASLNQHGLLQPIIVRSGERGYQVIAGNRRFAAATQLGWKTIPAVVRGEAEDQSYVLALVENLQRQDLTPREEAEALGELVRERAWSTRRVAEAIQRSQAFVSKRLRVFEDPLLAPAVCANELSISAAEELLSAPERRRYDLLARAIEGRWDRAQVRKAIHGGTLRRSGRRTSAIRHARQLRMELRDVKAEDLTETDRRELRLLFSELSMLARAQPGAARSFPPLPQTRTAQRRSR